MRGLRQFWLSDPRADHDRAYASLGDAIVGGEQEARRQLVAAEHSVFGLGQEQLKLGTASEPVHVLDDEDLGVCSLDDLQIALPKLVPGSLTSRLPRFEKPWHGGPPMTTSDWGMSPSRAVSISPRMWALAEVRCVGGCSMQIPLDRQHRLEPLPTKPAVMPPQPAKRSIRVGAFAMDDVLCTTSDRIMPARRS